MELEHLKKGETYYNKTVMYLNRIMRTYGNDFLERLRRMFFVASGINDEKFEDLSGLQLDRHLFLLFDITEDIETFMDSLLWMREHESYETDYSFDLSRGQHMIVLKLLEPFEQSIYHFKRGEYSKLYPRDSINELFQASERSKLPYRVVTKSYKRRLELEDMIGVELPESTELDSKPELMNETFNWSPKTEDDVEVSSERRVSESR